MLNKADSPNMQSFAVRERIFAGLAFALVLISFLAMQLLPEQSQPGALPSIFSIAMTVFTVENVPYTLYGLWKKKISIIEVFVRAVLSLSTFGMIETLLTQGVKLY